MKKILCLIDNLGSGGAQRQMVNLAVLLKEKGYPISFLIYGESRFFQHILDSANIAVDQVFANNSFMRIRKVKKYLQKCDADVVIAFLETPGFLACFAKNKKTNWKLITNELSAKESTFIGLKQKIFNFFEKRSNAKICNSYNAMRMWENHYPQYKEKLQVIYNPTIISDEVKDAEGINDEKFHIIVAASYQKLKNPIGVIEALRLLSESDLERLKIDWYGRKEVTVGDTCIYDESARLIEEYNLEKIISLHSETTEIYKKMANADAVGLFSTVEGLPNVICEAMTLGKPIIMTKVSDYKVLTEGNGILCDFDSSSIALGIKKLLSLSKKELEDMGRISKEKARKLFSKEAIVKQWMEVIDKWD